MSERGTGSITRQLAAVPGSEAVANDAGARREVAEAGPPDPHDRLAAALRALFVARRRRREATAADERLTRQMLETMQVQGTSLFWDQEGGGQAQLARSQVRWHDFTRMSDRWWYWGRQIPGLLTVDLGVLDALPEGHEGVRAFQQSVLQSPGGLTLLVEEWPAVTRRRAR